ncbi:MAG: cell division protein ZapA [Chitinophagales bacterium]
MEDLVSVSVTIGERRYPLKIRAADESFVREAEHMINEKFNEFQLRFTGQEKIDYLAMSALMNFVDILKNQDHDGEQNAVLLQKITEADKMLSEALKH